MARFTDERDGGEISAHQRLQLLRLLEGVSHWIPEAEPHGTAALLDDYARRPR